MHQSSLASTTTIFYSQQRAQYSAARIKQQQQQPKQNKKQNKKTKQKRNKENVIHSVDTGGYFCYRTRITRRDMNGEKKERKKDEKINVEK